MPKKIVPLAVACLLMLTVSAPAFASTVTNHNLVGSGGHIMLVNTDNVSATLDFSGT